MKTAQNSRPRRNLYQIPPSSSTSSATKHRNHVSRKRLELAPAKLRQGLSQLVRSLPGEIPLPNCQSPSHQRGSAIDRRNRELTCRRFVQPRLQAQGRSDPKVRPQPVPSVLPGEVQGHWLPQGEHDTARAYPPSSPRCRMATDPDPSTTVPINNRDFQSAREQGNESRGRIHDGSQRWPRERTSQRAAAAWNRSLMACLVLRRSCV